MRLIIIELFLLALARFTNTQEERKISLGNDNTLRFLDDEFPSGTSSAKPLIPNEVQVSEQTISFDSTFETTDNLDDDKGNIYVLTKLKVACGNYQALGGWQVKESGGKLRISYKCNTNLNIGTTQTTRRTEFINIGERKERQAHMLAKLNVTCNEDEALTGFVLVQESNVKIAYEFYCTPVKTTACKSITTPQTRGSKVYENGSTHPKFLSSQNIFLLDNEVLQSFKLNYENLREGTTYFYTPYNTYTYTYCTLPETTTAPTQEQINSINQLYNAEELTKRVSYITTEGKYSSLLESLTQFELGCGQNKAISGWRLWAKDTGYGYLYSCFKGDNIGSEVVTQSTNNQDFTVQNRYDASILMNYNVSCGNDQALQSFKL
jgi:hypothetical protein